MAIDKIADGSINQPLNILNEDYDKDKMKKSSFYEAEEKKIKDNDQKEEDFYDLDVQIKEKPDGFAFNNETVSKTCRCGSNGGSCYAGCTNSCNVCVQTYVNCR